MCWRFLVIMYVVSTYVHVSLPMSYVEHLRIMVLEKIPRATETFGQTWGTEYSVSGKVKSGNRINSLVHNHIYII